MDLARDSRSQSGTSLDDIDKKTRRYFFITYKSQQRTQKQCIKHIRRDLAGRYIFLGFLIVFSIGHTEGILTLFSDVLQVTPYALLQELRASTKVLKYKYSTVPRLWSFI